MAKLKPIEWIALILGAVIAFTYVQSGGKFLALPGTSSGGGGGGSNFCAYAPTVLVQGQFLGYANTPTIPVSAAMALNLTTPGQPGSIVSGITVAGAYQSYAGGNFVCGSTANPAGPTYLAYVGGAIGVATTPTFYLYNKTFNLGSNETYKLTALVDKYSAPLVQASNSPTGTFATNGVPIRSVAAGSQVTAYIRENASLYAFGQGTQAMQVAYNSPGLSSVSSFGAQPLNPALLPAPTFLTSNSGLGDGTNLGATAGAGNVFKMGAQNYQIAFLISAIKNFQYGVTTGTPAGTQVSTMSLTFTTGSTYGANEPIQVQFCPATNWFNTSSGLINTGVYINGVTKVGLFPCTGSTNMIILSPQ